MSQASQSGVVGIGGHSTGDVFTLKKKASNCWIASYEPLAPLSVGHNHTFSDYIIKSTASNGTEVEIDGSLCPIGIGCQVKDGTFLLFLLSEKYSVLIKKWVNCEIADRDGEVWLRSTRDITAGGELLTRYSHSNTYWALHS